MDVQPTAAPPGRLLRLGVVLDTRNPFERLREVARMCDRAGIGALWVEDPPPAPGGSGSARLEAWTALVLVAPDLRRARLGALLDAGSRSPALLARMAASLGVTVGGRLELTLRAGGGPVDLGGAVSALRAELATIWVPSMVSPGQAGPVLDAVALPAERPTIGVAVPTASPADLEWAAAIADDLVLPSAPIEATLEAAVAARQAAARAGRGTPLGIAARLPVSVGRTSAEALARWEAEPAFAALGRPDQVGIFGTLEQCHERVVALAHAGVTDLRCLLPNAIDIHDVIAQLTAMTVGSADKLVPGAPRTRVPEPPPGWGGRSRFPKA